MTRLDRIEQILENVAKEQARLIKEQEKTDEQLRKTEELIKELRLSQNQTDKILKEEIRKVNKQVGDLTNGWGKFVEGLSEPSVIASLKDIGFELLATASPYKYRKNGEEYEIDIFCKGKSNGKPIIIVIEVKSSLNQKKLSEFIEKLKEFREFFPEYKKIDLFGGLAGIKISKGIKERAEKEGLYLFSVKDNLMRNINSLNFNPKVW